MWRPLGQQSGDEVGRDYGDEFAGGNYFGLLPELGKMALVAGYHVVGPGGGALDELVVAGLCPRTPP
jgi:hypothetical protein